MELKSKEVEVGGVSLFVFLSNFAVNEFETSTGKKITQAGESTDLQLKLFFYCAKAGFLERGIDFPFTWEQFLNLPYLETMEVFSAAIYGKDPGNETTKKK